MSGERDRVIQMLEDGKITADEAARLIEALGAEQSKESFHPWHWARKHRMPFRELDRIPEIVSEAVSSSFGGMFGKASEGVREFPDKTSVFVKGISGHVDVISWDEQKCSVSFSGGSVKSRERNERLMLRSMSGDIDLKVARGARIEVLSVSGDVRATDFEGTLVVKSVSGDVVLQDSAGNVRVDVVSGDLRLAGFAGEFEVKSNSGDTDVDASRDCWGRITNRSGDVRLRLLPDANVTVTLECEGEGDMTMDLSCPHEVLEESERRLKFRTGEGDREITVRTRDGDIHISDTGGSTR